MTTATKPIPAEHRIGHKFGRLLITGIVKRLLGKSVWPTAYARCLCDCGAEATIAVHTIVRGRSRSCGCLNREVASGRAKHGLRRHPLYSVWLGMKNRCNNPNGTNYNRYGERGIYVSARWYSFPNFLSDMGERPSPRHTIERINNDGPYAWWNCRWATRFEQGHNTSVNRWITFGGESHILSDWARLFGVNQSTLHTAIDRRGETVAMRHAALRAGLQFPAEATP